MQVIKRVATPSLIRTFCKHVLQCEYGIADGLQDALNLTQKNIDELTDTELLILTQDVFNHLKLDDFYEIVDEAGYAQTKLIYNDFYITSDNKELFTLGKYGIQCIDLFNAFGDCLYMDAYWINFHSANYIEIIDQSSQVKIYKYDHNTRSLSLLAELKQALLDRFIEFSESLFFINGAFVDEAFKPKTPLCFDNGRDFSEGLAAVCLNGKWGYINNASEIIIDFTFGAAEPFKDGKAKVFVLESEYQIENGIWLEIESNNGYSDAAFKACFPNFPKTTRKPLSLLRNCFKTKEVMATEYHYFAETCSDHMGYWAEINCKGELVQTIDYNGPFKTINSLSDVKIYDMNYHIDRIKNHSNKSLAVSELPDELFINKTFVSRLLELDPSLFTLFNVWYSDDTELCQEAFNLDYTLYAFFSERLQLILKDQYEQKYKADSNRIFDSKAPKTELTDDLPF